MDRLAKELARLPTGTLPSESEVSQQVSDERKLEEKLHRSDTMHRSSFKALRMRSMAQRIVGSNMFDMVMGFVIICNSVVINIDQTARLNHDHSSSSSTIKFTELAENIFLLIYIFELLLRFTAHGIKCTYDGSVKFDIFLVVMGVVTSWIIQPLLGHLDGFGPVMVLRTVRLLRLARTVRLLVIFKELWILIRGLLNSMRTMFFTLVLLFLTLYVFASIAMELITNHSFARGAQAKPDFQDHVSKYFNSLPRTMITLLQFVTMDNGVVVYEQLINDDWTLVIYFVCMLLVVNIVLMNLVTAVLVNSAFEQTNQDKEAIKAFHDKEHKALLKSLMTLFMRIDSNKDGFLTREELLKICDEDRGELSKHVLVGNPLVIFDALDVDESGMISKEEFCEGIWQVALSNSPIELKRVEKQVDHIRRQLCGVISVRDTLHELQAQVKRALGTTDWGSADECVQPGHVGMQPTQTLIKQAAAINARLALTLAQAATEPCREQGTQQVEKPTSAVACTSDVFPQRRNKTSCSNDVTLDHDNKELVKKTATVSSSAARKECGLKNFACYQDKSSAPQPTATESQTFVDVLPRCAAPPKPPPPSRAPILLHHCNTAVTTPDDLEYTLLPPEACLQDHREQPYEDVLSEHNCTCELRELPRHGAPPGFIPVSPENQVEGKTDQILYLQGADLLPPDDCPALPPNCSLPVFQTLTGVDACNDIAR